MREQESQNMREHSAQADNNFALPHFDVHSAFSIAAAPLTLRVHVRYNSRRCDFVNQGATLCTIEINY